VALSQEMRSNELILARGLRAIAQLNRTLADIAVALPALLARKLLSEAVRRLTVDRNALEPLTSVPSKPVRPIELDRRPAMAGPRALDRRLTPWTTSHATHGATQAAQASNFSPPRSERGAPTSGRRAFGFAVRARARLRGRGRTRASGAFTQRGRRGGPPGRGGTLAASKRKAEPATPTRRAAQTTRG
jgi:hypothetical protein